VTDRDRYRYRRISMMKSRDTTPEPSDSADVRQTDVATDLADSTIRPSHYDAITPDEEKFALFAKGAQDAVAIALRSVYEEAAEKDDRLRETEKSLEEALQGQQHWKDKYKEVEAELASRKEGACSRPTSSRGVRNPGARNIADSDLEELRPGTAALEQPSSHLSAADDSLAAADVPMPPPSSYVHEASVLSERVEQLKGMLSEALKEKSELAAQCRNFRALANCTNGTSNQLHKYVEGIQDKLRECQKARSAVEAENEDLRLRLEMTQKLHDEERARHAMSDAFLPSSSRPKSVRPAQPDKRLFPSSTPCKGGAQNGARPSTGVPKSARPPPERRVASSATHRGRSLYGQHSNYLRPQSSR